MPGRAPAVRLFEDELIVDSFAGGGGASLGIEMALGRSPDVAINHDREAIAMHTANHPGTRHYCEDVWAVDPIKATGGKPVGLMWLSPDCKHFSKAKGGKPVEASIRGLAWVAVRWAKALGHRKPRVIILENVEEFQDWGPLLEDGRPCPIRKGLTFRRFVKQLENLGYAVTHTELVAADYGTPTIRNRLFLIARCDEQAIEWPDPTHGSKRIAPWHTAAECIQWDLPCPSIFGRDRPLAPNTLRRIARGIDRYVLNAADPFIVPGGAAPFLINTRNGERPGQDPRTRDLSQPYFTVTSQGSQGALVAAFLAKHNAGNEATGQHLGDAMHTVTARDTKALAVSHLMKLRGTSTAQSVNTPLHTISAGGGRGGIHFAEVRAFLLKYYGTDQDPQLREPMHTLTTKHRFGLVTVHGEDYAIADIGMRMLQPRELFRAQGFPDSYRIDVDAAGKPFTKSSQVRMCGNSVCPPVAAAIVRAQFGIETMEVAA